MRTKSTKFVGCLIVVVVVVLVLICSNGFRGPDVSVEGRISQLTGVPFHDVVEWVRNGIGEGSIEVNPTFYQVYRDGEVPSKYDVGFNAFVDLDGNDINDVQPYSTEGIIAYKKSAAQVPKTSDASEGSVAGTDEQAIDMLIMHSYMKSLDKLPKGIARDKPNVLIDQIMPDESMKEYLEPHNKDSSTWRLVTTIRFQELPDFMLRGLANISKEDIGRSLADIIGCMPKKLLRIRSVDKAAYRVHCQRDVECYLKEISDDKNYIVIETSDFNFIESPVDDSLFHEMYFVYGVTWIYVPEGAEIITEPAIKREEVQP